MPENGRTIIAVRDVTFGYTRKKTVLEHVSFDVPQGQSLAILGYNGAGKTTLFNIIVGLLRPRSGEAIINANLVPSMQDVFQLSDESNLAATMTVRENIRFRAMLMDTGRGSGRRAIDPAHLENEKLVQAFGWPSTSTRKSRSCQAVCASAPDSSPACCSSHMSSCSTSRPTRSTRSPATS